MKYFKFLFLLAIVLMIVISSSCERDDICPDATPTTPSLILRAYDFSNQENRKNIFGLRVQGINNNNVLTNYNIVTSDSIVLPLRTDTIATQYRLHKEYTFDDNNTPDDTSDDIYGGNEDIITVRYATEQVFVSRACGYKTIFKNVTLTIVQDGNNWILSRQSANDNQSVEDETAAHFNIYH